MRLFFAKRVLAKFSPFLFCSPSNYVGRGDDTKKSFKLGVAEGTKWTFVPVGNGKEKRTKIAWVKWKCAKEKLQREIEEEAFANVTNKNLFINLSRMEKWATVWNLWTSSHCCCCHIIISCTLNRVLFAAAPEIERVQIGLFLLLAVS